MTGRGAVGAGAAILPPALVLGDSLAAWRRGWHPAAGASLVLLAAGAFTLAIALSILAARGRRFWNERWARFLALVLFGLGPLLGADLVLVALEARRERALFHHKAPHLCAVFRPDPAIMPGVSPVATFSTNALGIRGPEWVSGRRVLCVGGSTTECLYLDDTRTWTHLLGEKLHVWTGDVGTSGYTSAEHLRFLEESPLAREPDTFVVLVGINDLIRALGGEPFPRGIIEHPRPVWSRSLLLGPVLDRLGIPRREPPIALAVEDDRGQAYVARRRLRAGSPVCRDMPDLSGKLDAYEERLRRMIEVVRSRGQRIVFVTQPALWEPNLPEKARASCWLGRMRDGSFLDLGLLRRGLDLVNARLLKVATEARVPVTDLHALDGRTDVFYDDCHFTELGAREVAQYVAATLSSGDR